MTERYTVTIEHRGSNGTLIIRQALKLLGRRFGLKCTSVRLADDAVDSDAHDEGGKPV